VPFDSSTQCGCLDACMSFEFILRVAMRVISRLGFGNAYIVTSFYSSHRLSLHAQ
jgi:hypothetical protein